MKILAIRGKNLASLVGEFSIEFAQGPLASAGLFALSGPTGSGKSTILDALCLALFDDTPRLKNVTTGVALRDVGEHTINQNHTANVLRRGCGDGYAEVDFIGADHGTYRARWSASRSRNQSHGKLQSVKMALFSIDSDINPLTSKPDELQTIGGTKTEVLKEIRDRLGLNFDQFTRAVLLAQNEFSAFLKAPDDERAALLEALTGTEIYSLISKYAYECSKAEKAKLDTLESQLNLGKPMDEEARTAAELNLATLNEQVTASQLELAAIETTLTWFTTLNALLTSEQEATTAVQLAHEQLIASDADRQQQTKRDTAESARPNLVELDRLATAQQGNSKLLAEHEIELTRAQTEQAAQALATSNSLKQLQDAQQELVNKTPEIHKARELDAQLATLLPQQEQHQTTLNQLSNAVTESQGIHAQQELEHQQLEQKIAATKTWLSDHASLASLAGQWARWESLFKDAVWLRQQKTQSTTECQTLTSQKSKLVDAIAKLHFQFETAQLSHQKQQSVVEKITKEQAELGSLDISELNTKKQAMDSRVQGLTACLTIWQQWYSKQQQSEIDQSALLQHQADSARLNTAIKSTEATLDESALQLKEARSAYIHAELANTENVQAMRASLQDQSPCPVCGSREHPYAETDPVIASLLSKLKDKATQLEQTHDLAQQSLNKLSGELSVNRVQVERLNQQIAETEITLEQHQFAWQAQPLAGEWALIADSERDPKISSTLRQLETERSQLQATLDRALALQQALTQAQTDFQSAQKQLHELEQQLKTHQNDLKTLETALQHNLERTAEADQSLTRVLTELDAAFDNTSWQTAWHQDSVQFVARCQSDVSMWQSQSTNSTDLMAQLQHVQTELMVLNERIEEQTKAFNTKQQEFVRFNLDYQSLQTSRQALLNGKVASDVEQSLKTAITIQEKQYELAQQSLVSANTRSSECETTLKHLRETGAVLQQELTQSHEILTGWISEFGPQLNIAEISALRALLSWDLKQRETERQRLLDIEKRCMTSQTVLKERQEKLEQHRLNKEIEGTEQDWDIKQQTTKASHTGLQDLLATQNVELRQDNERREQARGLQGAIDQQAATTRLWLQLNELIGSESGKKFRNYAQQLTMDILLGYANMHLETLSRRYRLQRIPDNLALQVLDQDMGDEVRSVHSLSGGESFLVSLALALGLASLSSNRVQVETLFIDEGFGSLDGETLQVAMTALDCLQAQGRKVGVITHVQEMIERIEVQIKVKKSQHGASQLEVVS